MKPSEMLKEIRETYRIHKELAPSQVECLIARIERLEKALRHYSHADDCPKCGWKMETETADRALEGDE